jgi:hypothetical protein
MTMDIAEKVARAVLYEGYMLYPYRPSALKNQRRLMLGTLYPRRFVEPKLSSSPYRLQAEFLALVSPRTLLKVSLRFLQIRNAFEETCGNDFVTTPQKGQEREVLFGPLPLNDLCGNPRTVPFAFGETDASQPEGRVIEGRIRIEGYELAGSARKLTTTVENLTSIAESDSHSHFPDSLLCHAIASPQLIFRIESGEFVSPLDPPEQFRAEVARCQNTGVFPVLIGEPGSRNAVLASPVILYDYPQVASESGGDFFDATEIDELLSLRVKTLTDEEKSQMRSANINSREILQRVETASPEALTALHGRLRRLDGLDDEPKRNEISGVASSDAEEPFTSDLKIGDQVRIWPRRSADIMDTVLTGQIATVESVETDFEDRLHIAVVLQVDPGAELGFERRIGHRFFFAREELERLLPKSRAGI